MKTAVINSSGRRVGGVETYLGTLMPALRQAGHEIFFWYEQVGPDDRDAIEGLETFPSCCAGHDGFPSALRVLQRWQPDVLFVHSLSNPDHERNLLTVAPAVFFAHAYYGTCISGAKAFRLPVIEPCARRFGPACLLQYFPRRCGGLSPLTMFREYTRNASRLQLLHQYAGVVTFSEHMRREYLKHGFQPNRVHRLPPIDPLNGVGPSPRNRARAAASARGDGGKPIWRLTFMGRIELLKGCGVLIEALRHVRPNVSGRVLLTVAGDGPDLESCRDKARSVVTALPDLEVRFLGWTPHEKCVDLLDETDVFVMPSLWPEPLGLGGIEALHRGVPVAAFAVGAIPEWLEDGRDGALAPGDPPTAKGLAHAIVRCLMSAKIQRSVRDNRRSADAYSIQRHVESLIPVLAAAQQASVSIA